MEYRVKPNVHIASVCLSVTQYQGLNCFSDLHQIQSFRIRCSYKGELMKHRLANSRTLFLGAWCAGCPRRKGPNFGRVFLRSNYNDITQNTYIQSSMVTEILAREF